MINKSTCTSDSKILPTDISSSSLRTDVSLRADRYLDANGNRDHSTILDHLYASVPKYINFSNICFAAVAEKSALQNAD